MSREGEILGAYKDSACAITYLYTSSSFPTPSDRPVITAVGKRLSLCLAYRPWDRGTTAPWLRQPDKWERRVKTPCARPASKQADRVTTEKGAPQTGAAKTPFCRGLYIA